MTVHPLPNGREVEKEEKLELIRIRVQELCTRKWGIAVISPRSCFLLLCKVPLLGLAPAGSTFILLSCWPGMKPWQDTELGVLSNQPLWSTLKNCGNGVVQENCFQLRLLPTLRVSALTLEMGLEREAACLLPQGLNSVVAGGTGNTHGLA